MREIPVPPTLATALHLHTEGGAATQNAQLSLAFGESTPAAHARATLDQVVAAHPILRGGFFRTESNGFTLREAEPREVRWQHVDWTKTDPSQIPALWKAFLAEDAQRPFSLENPPLLRGASLELPGGNTHYLLTFPSFLLDDRTLFQLLCQWLGALDGQAPVYTNFPEPGETAGPEVLEKWQARLTDAPRPIALEIFDPAPSATGEAEPLVSLFTRERSRKIRELAEQLDVDAYSVFLGAALLVLGRLDSRSDALTLATNSQGDNLLPVRLGLKAGDTLGEMIRDLHRQSSEIASSTQVSLPDLLAPANLALRDFGPVFVWGAPLLSDLVHDALPRWINVDARILRPAIFPLVLQVRDAGRFSVEFHHDAKVFSPRIIAELAERYDGVLEKIAEDPSRELQEISLLLAHEEANAVAEEKPTEGAPGRVEERFAEAAGRQADDLAIQGDGEASLTYSELHAHAQSLANYLRQENLADGWVIATCLTLTPWLPVALLGIPLAGDTCIALDPANSPTWLSAEAAACDAELIICDSFTAPFFEGSTRRLLIIDQQWETIEAAPRSEEAGSPPATAFLLTGTEKVPAPEFRKLTPALLGQAVKEASARYNLRPGTRLPLTAAAGTGAFLEIIFSALTTGATLVLPASDTPLLKTAQDSTHLRLSFDQWRQLLLELAAAGEPLPEIVRSVCVHTPHPSAALFTRWQPLVGESVSTHFFWSPVDLSGLALRVTLRGETRLNHVPIGHPTAGLTARLADACGQPLPPAYIGRLEVSLTSDASVHWSLPAWRDEEGFLHLASSQDEEIARRLPGVRDAVLGETGSQSSRGLWLILDDQADTVPPALQEEIIRLWPANRKPDFIYAIFSLPLTPGGEIDLSGFPRPLPPKPTAKPEPAAKPAPAPRQEAPPPPAPAAPVKAMPWEPLVPLSQDPAAPILVLVHDLEGEPTKYEALISLLREDWSVYGTTARGIVQPNACHQSIEAEAAALVEALSELDPEGPYYLLGHGFGAVLAFEMARQLRLTQRPVDYLALLGSEPPALEGRKEWLRSLSKMFGGSSKPALPPGPPVVEAHRKALEAYRAKPIEGPVGIILASDQSKDAVEGWMDCAPEAIFEHMNAPADQIIKEPSVRRLAIILGEWIVSSEDDQ